MILECSCPGGQRRQSKERLPGAPYWALDVQSRQHLVSSQKRHLSLLSRDAQGVVGGLRRE